MYRVAFSPSQQTNNRYTGVSTTEKIEMEKLAKACHKYHVEKGGKALTFFYPDDEFYSRVDKAKNFDADVYIALHTNAGGGSGPETFHAPNSPISRNLCTVINKRLTEYFLTKGIRNTRANPVGIKDFHEINKPASYNMLHSYVEVNFHDNANIAKVMVANWNAIAKVIVDAIWEAMGWVAKVEPKPAPDTKAPDYHYYRVCTTSYKSRNSAYAEVERLKKEHGISAFVAYVNTPTKK